MKQRFNTYLSKAFILFSFLFLMHTEAKAQLEFGTQLNMRGMTPGFGYGIFGELGIPSDDTWRLSFRGYFANFGEGVPDYVVSYHKTGDKAGEVDESKNYKGIPMTSFDRGIGIRIYYQQTEFQPYLGLGATYAYNDILKPDDTPEFDTIERTLNIDYTLGASYLLGDNVVVAMELHYANVTRNTYVDNTSFFGFNVLLSYRFGSNKFSNVYE